MVARVAEKGDFGASLRVLTMLTTICGVGIVVLYKHCSVAVQREADAGYACVGVWMCGYVTVFLAGRWSVVG